LRHVPLREFNSEDLRIMIGQNIGLQYLVPLALERLDRHSLTHGDYYPGDLLASTLRADHNFWRDHVKWRTQLQRIAERTLTSLRGRSHKKKDEFRITLEALTEAYDTSLLPPLRSNKSLQPTATRCAFRFLMTKPVPQILSLASGSRG
jgi:contact-dependent growth inhibition (CDI) system CdiI-like immunity protein